MSIILIHRSKTDSEALLYLLNNSESKISDELGKNGIVVELNSVKNTPYSKLFWNESTNTIETATLEQFVLKIVLIQPSGKAPEIFRTTTIVRPQRHSHSIIYADSNKFENEILTQKLIFMQSCMIDCQLRGICVDCISSFFVDNSKIKEFISLLRIPKLDRLAEELIAKDGIRLGCILMEKMGPSLQQHENYIKEIHDVDEKRHAIDNYMRAKANSLICVDKLHYLGVRHYDVKPDNIVDGILIDFGESRGIDIPNSTDTRQRKFNILTEIPDVYTAPEIIRSEQRGARPQLETRGNYILDSIFGLESVRISRNGKCLGEYRKVNAITELCDYYDFFEDKRYTETISGKGTRQKITLNFKEKYPAIDVMNELDIEHVRRGNAILTFLLNFKCGHECSEEERTHFLKEFVHDDKQLPYRIVSRIQYGYYSLLNNYIDKNPSAFSCFNILLRHNANCLTMFTVGAKPLTQLNNINEGFWYPGHAGGFRKIMKTRRNRKVSRKK